MTPCLDELALRWTPPGKRKRGWPKMTWRQTAMAELKEKGLSWLRPQLKIGPCGKTLLWPYVPLEMKRISEEVS